VYYIMLLFRASKVLHSPSGTGLATPAVCKFLHSSSAHVFLSVTAFFCFVRTFFPLSRRVCVAGRPLYPLFAHPPHAHAPRCVEGRPLPLVSIVNAPSMFPHSNPHAARAPRSMQTFFAYIPMLTRLGHLRFANVSLKR